MFFICKLSVLSFIMEVKSPLEKSKEELQNVIDKISLPNSPVGIDAQYTHAIILDYLRQIDSRVRRLEETLNKDLKQH